MSFHICELKILCTKMNIYNIRIYCCFVLTKYSKCTQMPHCERRGILMLYTHEESYLMWTEKIQEAQTHWRVNELCEAF